MPDKDLVPVNETSNVSEKSGLHTLFFPAWYPNPDDPQNGSFIRKHALAASLCSNISVLFVKSGERKLVELIQNGNLIECTSFFKKSPNKLLSLARYLSAAFTGYKKLTAAAGKPNLINITVLDKNLLPAILLSRLHNIPYLVTEHWSGFISSGWSRLPSWKKNIHKRTYKKASAIIVVSDVLKNSMQKAGVSGNFLKVPNVIETLPRPVPTEKTQFLVLADLVDHVKNISGIIGAFSKALATHPEAKLVIAGGGNDEQMLRELGAASPAAKSISFTGRVRPKEALNLIASAGCIIINSRYETFSMVAAEALAHGKPLICTRCGGPEEFLNENNARLIPTDNIKELTLAMQDYLDEKLKFSPEMLSASVAGFSQEKTGKTLCEIFKRYSRAI